MFLSLAPYLMPAQITNIFGRDLLDDITQLSGFHELMSDTLKPFECVADVHEARESMLQLVNSPHWAEHAVVVASRNMALQYSPRPKETNTESSFAAFASEIDSFLGDAE
jgi:hypothetical protein